MATDLSDKSWDDLYSTDYDILRELASEIDALDGNASREEICVGLFKYHDRVDEIPDEYVESVPQTQYSEETDTDDENSDDTESEGDDDTEGDESADDFTTAANHEPERDSAWIIDGGRIQAWVSHINCLVDECKVHIEHDGIRTRAVDPANVGMVEVTLDERAFESFDVNGEGVIGVNTVRLADVVGNAKTDELVAIDYDATTRNLVIQIGGHEWTIGLIEPDSIRAEPDLPDLDLPVEVDMEAGVFKDGVLHADSVSDHTRIASYPEGVFSVFAEGDTDSYEGRFDDGDGVEFVYRPGEETYSLFSNDYLKDMTKPLDSDQTITIIHGHEFPMTLKSHVDDEPDVGSVEYMLAPRIQSE